MFRFAGWGILCCFSTTKSNFSFWLQSELWHKALNKEVGPNIGSTNNNWFWRFDFEERFGCHKRTTCRVLKIVNTWSTVRVLLLLDQVPWRIPKKRLAPSFQLCAFNSTESASFCWSTGGNGVYSLTTWIHGAACCTRALRLEQASVEGMCVNLIL